MSAGGFGVTVEQFNNVHFHALPDSRLSFSRQQRAIVRLAEETERRYRGRNDTKGKEKVCEYKGETPGESASGGLG